MYYYSITVLPLLRDDELEVFGLPEQLRVEFIGILCMLCGIYVYCVTVLVINYTLQNNNNNNNNYYRPLPLVDVR